MDTANNVVDSNNRFVVNWFHRMPLSYRESKREVRSWELPADSGSNTHRYNDPRQQGS
jgi:hypothetical protein